MDLEKVALEAVKVKVQEIFSKVMVRAFIEDQDIIIRITMPEEITTNTFMNDVGRSAINNQAKVFNEVTSNLDKEAQAAANELLGTQEMQ